MPTHQYNLFSDPLEDSVIAAFPQFEGSEIEYKSARGGFPGAFWETYSAFANTEGGLIVLGVKEEAINRFVPDGLTLVQTQRFRQDFFDTQNNRNKISADLLKDANVRHIPVPDQPDQYFLVFDIPRANREQMPVYVGLDPNTGTYKRRDSGDYRCNRDAVRRMIADSDANVPADSRILRGFVYPDDLDLRSIQQFRQLMSTTRPGHTWLAEDDLGLLRKLGAYRQDRQSKQEGLTLAGVLMFGKTEAIHDPECAPQFFPDYQEVLTQDPEVRWTDRLYPDGTWEANLFQFFRMAWPRISAGLPRPFQLKNGQRQDETPAHTALREAFINSLVHADYSAPGSLVSIRRTHGFQFTNPGTLLVSMRQYYEGGTSICRNKSLQRMFSFIGGAEQAGSGADKIVRGWESARWMRPYLDVRDEPDRVTLELEMASILSGQAHERLHEAFGERAAALFGDALTVLSIVALEDTVTHRSLRYRVNMHAADLSGLLKTLCQEEFLVSTGRGPGTTYALNEDDSVAPQETSSVGNEKNSLQKAVIATDKMESLSQKMETSYGNLETSTKKLETSSENLETSAENLETSIKNLDTTGNEQGQVPASVKLEQTLLEAAKQGWRSLPELAEATSKNGKYLINEVIPALIKAGKLERRFAPNHPRQAYRTVH
ncbi:RNA-binding domain-containing protein [uncultured Hymenobacter sp.]|uniref:RNA-binding domain-containing protein n=1 Tax=uncultured Hymenobacter sp. TaxID=170016 RepID=UPI0035C962BE